MKIAVLGAGDWGTALAAVLARAQALGVEMPLTAAVVEVLAGRLSAAKALARLMRRDARAETPHG